MKLVRLDARLGGSSDGGIGALSFTHHGRRGGSSSGGGGRGRGGRRPGDPGVLPSSALASPQQVSPRQHHRLPSSLSPHSRTDHSDSGGPPGLLDVRSGTKVLSFSCFPPAVAAPGAPAAAQPPPGLPGAQPGHARVGGGGSSSGNLGAGGGTGAGGSSAVVGASGAACGGAIVGPGAVAGVWSASAWDAQGPRKPSAGASAASGGGGVGTGSAGGGGVAAPGKLSYRATLAPADGAARNPMFANAQWGGERLVLPSSHGSCATPATAGLSSGAGPWCRASPSVLCCLDVLSPLPGELGGASLRYRLMLVRSLPCPRRFLPFACSFPSFGKRRQRSPWWQWGRGVPPHQRCWTTGLGCGKDRPTGRTD
jgi:hypothetical protein